jgi:hypothetical protein
MFVARPTPVVRGLLVAPLLLLAACGGDKSTAPKDPPTITVVGKGIAAERYMGELNVRGDYAYTSTWGTRAGVRGNAVKIWNVAGDKPLLVDSLIIPTVNAATPTVTTGDVQVSDDGSLLVVATERFGGSIVIYTLADPAHPAFVTQFHTAEMDAGVHTAEIARVGGKLYGFLSIDPGNGPAKLVVVDLSTPSAPVQVLVREMGNPFVHDVFVRDSLLFTALWDDGVSIWDIGGSRGGSPANPVLVSNVRTLGGEVHNVWWFHNPVTGSKRYLFVGQEGPASLFTSSSGDIHVVDMSDLLHPVEVARYTVPNAGTHNFSVDEASGVLYAAYYNGGVRAIDVRGDLSQCTAAQRFPDNTCNLGAMGRELGRGISDGAAFVWGVQYVGNRLYASDMLGALWKLDISPFKR